MEPLPSTAFPLRTNSKLAIDYSGPTECGYRNLRVKGYVHEVVIAHGSKVIVRHGRSYGHEAAVFDPLHSQELLEQKTRPPLSRLGKSGSREYIQVLRLLKTFAPEPVSGSIVSTQTAQ